MPFITAAFSRALAALATTLVLLAFHASTSSGGAAAAAPVCVPRDPTLPPPVFAFGGSGWNLVYYAGVLESLQQAGALNPLTSRLAGVSGGSVAAATSGAGLSGKQMYDILMDTLSTCEAGSCQIALAAVFRALLPPDVGTVYGSRVTVFVTKLNALGVAGGAVSGMTSPKTALIRYFSPGKNSSFSASSPAHAAIATVGRNWPSAADIADDELRGASPWAISSYATPADVVGAVSSSSFLPCWSAPIPFYVYKNKPVIDGGFSTDFAAMCAAALNGTAKGTECVRVAGSVEIGPFVKQGNDDRSGMSCELPKRRKTKLKKSSLRRKLLQMGVLPRAALAAEDAWLSEIDRSMAAEFPQQLQQQQQQQQQQQPAQVLESSSSGSGDGGGEGAAAAAAVSAQAASVSSAQAEARAAAAIAAAAAEASAVSAQSDAPAPSSGAPAPAPDLPPPPPARLNPLTESLTTLSFAVASAVSNATAGASVPTPTLPETTPLCPKKEAATASWPRLTNLTSDGVPSSIYPGKFAGSPLPFTPCEWQKLVLNLTPAVLPKVYAAGVADGAEWARANGFCGAAGGG